MPVLQTLQDSEEWRDVVGWEEFYQVSSHGRVRSKDRIVNNGRKDYLVKGRILKLRKLRDGRLRVSLCRNAKPQDALVHSLVLTAFVGERPNGYDGCHNDGDVTNNRLDNLRWDTKKNNQADRVRHGTMLYGEDNHRSTLTNKQIEEIYVDQRKQKDIAKDYGVSQKTVSKIKTKNRWLGCVAEDKLKTRQKNHSRRPVIGTSLADGEKIRFTSAFAARHFGFTPRSICRCCHGAGKSHKGYAWEFSHD